MKAVLLSLFPSLGATAALACLPVPMQPSATPETSAGCAIEYVLGEARAVGLGAVIDLGDGRVWQDWFDGNICHWSTGSILHECASGTALAFGPDARSLETEPRVTGIDRILDAVGAGAEDVARLVQAEGYAAPRRLASAGALELGGTPVPLDCACRSLYPDLAAGDTQ